MKRFPFHGCGLRKLFYLYRRFFCWRWLTRHKQKEKFEIKYNGEGFCVLCGQMINFMQTIASHNNIEFLRSVLWIWDYRQRVWHLRCTTVNLNFYSYSMFFLWRLSSKIQIISFFILHKRCSWDYHKFLWIMDEFSRLLHGINHR